MFVDLSHPIRSGMAAYPGFPVPRVEPFISHPASRPAYQHRAEFEITRLFMVGNTGTYLDSPYHRHPGTADIGSLPLESMAGLPGRVVVPGRSGDGRALKLQLSDDLAGSALLVRTGWDERWGSAAYWQPGPFLGASTVRRLVDLGVALVGVDFWNVDDTSDPARPAHTHLLGASIPIVEHLTGLDRLPLAGFRFFAVPAPVLGAASMPVRAFAEVEADVGRQ
jgi:arylformamidase